MNRKIVRVFPLFAIVALAAAGCAKNQVVKKDEGLVQPAAASQKAQSPQTADAKAATSASALKPIVVADPAVAPLSGAGAKESNVASSDNEGKDDLRHGLSAIYFGFDSAALDQAARQKLADALAVLKKAAKNVRIEGYCDERGSDEYNLALGERRAQAAKQYLTTLGIPAERLTTISYGNEKPADPGHNETAWAKNRRDEFVVVQ